MAKKLNFSRKANKKARKAKADTSFNFGANRAAGKKRKGGFGGGS